MCRCSEKNATREAVGLLRTLLPAAFPPAPDAAAPTATIAATAVTDGDGSSTGGAAAQGMVEGSAEGALAESHVATAPDAPASTPTPSSVGVVKVGCQGLALLLVEAGAGGAGAAGGGVVGAVQSLVEAVVDGKRPATK